MKKIILSMVLVLSIIGSFAQKSNVTKARNKTLIEIPDYEGARKAITPALTDSITKNWAKTWYVAGTIGYGENNELLNKASKGEDVDNEKRGQLIMESYNYFLKAYELDSLPDEKGKIKPKYSKDIKEKIKEYFIKPYNLYTYGVTLYQEKKYEEAVKVFETYLIIPQLPMMKNEIKTDSIYTMVKFYTAVSARNLNQYEKTIALCEDIKDGNFDELTVYMILFGEYEKVKDTLNYVKTLKEGYDKFPEEGLFLQHLIRHYISTKEIKEAITYVSDAINRDPENAKYIFIKGKMDESLGNIDAAREAFKKAVEIDPTLAEGHAGIGRLIYNKAVKMSDDAVSIKENEKYNAARKKVDAVFRESLPYFKIASELEPNEIEYKQTLKNLYYRLDMYKEYKAIEQELNQ